MKEQTEVWKVIPGHEAYEVSNFGRVRSWYKGGRGNYRRATPAIISGGVLKNGYRLFSLAPGRQQRYAHRLVALAFLGPCPPGMQVNHIDGNKTNNHLSNLEYVTPRENILHSVHVLGNKPPRRVGKSYGAAKLTEAQVKEIRAEYDGKHGRCSELARKYGVSSQAVWNILNGKTWTHI
jgi:hypothetical protein